MKLCKYKYWLVLFLVSISITAIAPYLLTRTCGSIKFLEEEAHVGDTIGGTTTPIVGLISIFLLILTLYEQKENNIKVLQLTYRQHFKDVYMGILNNYCSNRNKLAVKVTRCYGYRDYRSCKTTDYYDFFTEMTVQVNLIWGYLNANSFPASIDYSLIEKEYENLAQNDPFLTIADIESIPDMGEQKRVKEINSQYDERIKKAFYYAYYDINVSEYNIFHKYKNDISKQMSIVFRILLRKFPQLKPYIKQVKQISTYSIMSENEYITEYQPKTKGIEVFGNYYELLDELIINEERLLLFYISVTDLSFFNNLNHMRLFEKLNRKKIMHSELFKSYINF